MINNYDVIVNKKEMVNFLFGIASAERTHAAVREGRLRPLRTGGVQHSSW